MMVGAHHAPKEKNMHPCGVCREGNTHHKCELVMFCEGCKAGECMMDERFRRIVDVFKASKALKDRPCDETLIAEFINIFNSQAFHFSSSSTCSLLSPNEALFNPCRACAHANKPCNVKLTCKRCRDGKTKNPRPCEPSPRLQHFIDYAIHRTKLPPVAPIINAITSQLPTPSTSQSTSSEFSPTPPDVSDEEAAAHVMRVFLASENAANVHANHSSTSIDPIAATDANSVPAAMSIAGDGNLLHVVGDIGACTSTTATFQGGANVLDGAMAGAPSRDDSQQMRKVAKGKGKSFTIPISAKRKTKASGNPPGNSSVTIAEYAYRFNQPQTPARSVQRPPLAPSAISHPAAIHPAPFNSAIAAGTIPTPTSDDGQNSQKGVFYFYRNTSADNLLAPPKALQTRPALPTPSTGTTGSLALSPSVSSIPSSVSSPGQSHFVWPQSTGHQGSQSAYQRSYLAAPRPPPSLHPEPSVGYPSAASHPTYSYAHNSHNSHAPIPTTLNPPTYTTTASPSFISSPASGTPASVPVAPSGHSFSPIVGQSGAHGYANRQYLGGSVGQKVVVASPTGAGPSFPLVAYPETSRESAGQAQWNNRGQTQYRVPRSSNATIAATQANMMPAHSSISQPGSASLTVPSMGHQLAPTAIPPVMPPVANTDQPQQTFVSQWQQQQQQQQYPLSLQSNAPDFTKQWVMNNAMSDHSPVQGLGQGFGLQSPFESPQALAGGPNFNAGHVSNGSYGSHNGAGSNGFNIPTQQGVGPPAHGVSFYANNVNFMAAQQAMFSPAFVGGFVGAGGNGNIPIGHNPAMNMNQYSPVDRNGNLNVGGGGHFSLSSNNVSNGNALCLEVPLNMQPGNPDAAFASPTSASPSSAISGAGAHHFHMHPSARPTYANVAASAPSASSASLSASTHRRVIVPPRRRATRSPEIEVPTNGGQVSRKRMKASARPGPSGPGSRSS